MTKWEFISKYVWQLLFGVAILVIFLMDTCKKPCPDVNSDGNDTVYVFIHDTIDYHDTTYVPVPGETVIKEVPKWVELAADTQAILDMYVDYLSYMVYDDILLDDTNGFVRVIDTIQKNKIKSRTVEKRFYPTYIRIVKTIQKEYVPRNEFYAGGAVGGSLNSFGVEVSGMFINKKKHAYTLSYDFVQSEVKVGIMFKIF